MNHNDEITALLSGENMGKEVARAADNSEGATRSFTSHTPGPWKLKLEPPTPDYEFPYMRLTAGEGYFGTEGSGFDISGIANEADARLMVSAPDLLAALNVALNEFHHPGACHYERGQDIVDFIEAAIKKAKTS